MRLSEQSARDLMAATEPLRLEAHRVHLAANALAAFIARPEFPGTVQAIDEAARYAVQAADATMYALGLRR